MKVNVIISYLIRFIWIFTIFLIIFLDRNNKYQVILTISVLIIISIITAIRSLISRNEWRQIIKDGDIEIKDKIKF